MCRAVHERAVAVARSALMGDVFEVRAAGRALSSEQIVAEVLAEAQSLPAWPAPTAELRTDPLTPHEREVTLLVAPGADEQADRDRAGDHRADHREPSGPHLRQAGRRHDDAHDRTGNGSPGEPGHRRTLVPATYSSNTTTHNPESYSRSSNKCLPDGLDNYESIAKQLRRHHPRRCVVDDDRPVAEQCLGRR